MTVQMIWIRSLIAKQLGYPTGIIGQSIMKLLNRGNATMNDVTYAQLDLQPHDCILEIGFGGGYLLEKIATSQIPELVVGVDPQVDVVQMGRKKFKTQIDRRSIELKQAIGENLPYSDRTFSKICTVNTIYFWSDPAIVLAECHRKLKPNGKLIICYNSPAFIEQKKLTEHGFKVYHPEQLESLMKNAGFTALNTISADGETGNGLFFCTIGVAAES